jgi:hypothetical protein
MNNIKENLAQLTAGLLFMSETEAPFSVKEVENTDFLAAENATSVELADFFRNATRHSDWHSPEEKQIVSRFQALFNYLESLAARVHKTSPPAAEIYIVIADPSKGYIILQTQVVET